MTDWTRKTRHEPPARDRRKVDARPHVKGPALPRRFLLTIVTTEFSVHRETTAYVSAAAREQAKLLHEKRLAAEKANPRRRWYWFGRSSDDYQVDRDVRYEFSERKVEPAVSPKPKCP